MDDGRNLTFGHDNREYSAADVFIGLVFVIQTVPGESKHRFMQLPLVDQRLRDGVVLFGFDQFHRHTKTNEYIDDQTESVRISDGLREIAVLEIGVRQTIVQNIFMVLLNDTWLVLKVRAT